MKCQAAKTLSSRELGKRVLNSLVDQDILIKLLVVNLQGDGDALIQPARLQPAVSTSFIPINGIFLK